MNFHVKNSFNLFYDTTISASEIQSLEVHEAFVKVPGSLPATKIKFTYRHFQSPTFARKIKEHIDEYLKIGDPYIGSPVG